MSRKINANKGLCYVSRDEPLAGTLFLLRNCYVSGDTAKHENPSLRLPSPMVVCRPGT
jgi:hypothetical protein